MKIDLAGALVSALLLGLVLPRWEEVFGLPPWLCYGLAALPVVFALVDAYALTRSPSTHRPWLRRVAALNLSYCLLSLVLAAVHAASLTVWGWAYIVGEVLIVASLARVEYAVAIAEES